ncbi:MAG: polysaccharide biosynthesis/export family protein [Bryobacterales bacterium]|nr:polysaccharide biosynthesis/export family protein [Bryobacterales bacterium]
MRLFRIAMILLAAVSLVSAQRQSNKKRTAEEAEPQAVEEKEKKPEETKAGLVAGAPVDPNNYRIGAEDVINIRVWREADLSGNVVVRPDGKIALPLVGEIEAAGSTPNELTARLEEALGQVMVKPQVLVSIVQVNSKKYYISGQANRTGAFPLVVPLTVLEALSIAGGLQEFANGSKIVVMRGDKRIKFNYKDVLKGKNMQQNIRLEPGDHIIVP